MLVLYYSPLSPNARRVWVSLLEKGLTFDLKPLSLKGDQRQPDFIAINPFQQIPVLVDNGFRIVESLAILDYLEARYPEPSFVPIDPQSLAIVRMVEQLTDNKLLYTLGTLIAPDIASPAYHHAIEIVNRTLAFWEKCLADNPYFGGDRLSLGDIVAGTTLPLFLRLGISLDPYPRLETWIAQLQSRSSWKETELSEESWREFKRRIRVLIMMQNKRRIGN